MEDELLACIFSSKATVGFTDRAIVVSLCCVKNSETSSLAVYSSLIGDPRRCSSLVSSMRCSHISLADPSPSVLSVADWRRAIVAAKAAPMSRIEKTRTQWIDEMIEVAVSQIRQYINNQSTHREQSNHQSIHAIFSFMNKPIDLSSIARPQCLFNI